MEILYLLIPLSTALVLLILGVFAWALWRGQFEDLEREGQRILDDDLTAVDDDQLRSAAGTEQSPPSEKRAQEASSHGNEHEIRRPDLHR